MVPSFVWKLVLKRCKSFMQYEFQGRQEGAVHFDLQTGICKHSWMLAFHIQRA